MSGFSKFIRKSLIQSLFKDIQAENRSSLKTLQGKIETLIRQQNTGKNQEQFHGSPNTDSLLPLHSDPLDLLITHNEICPKHGTGVLLGQLFKGGLNLMNIRSRTQFDGESLGDLQITLDHQGKSRAESFFAVASALLRYNIRRILCVPFYPDDVITAISAHEITGAPMCLYLLDDQNIHCQGIPDALMRELIQKSQLRLAVGPEMRDQYEIKYGHKFWVLPPTVPAEFINETPSSPSPTSSAGKAVLIGNIWSPSWLDALRRTARESGITIDWYGNTDKRMHSYDEGELANDGIHVQGFLPEAELQSVLHNYAFAIVPSTPCSINETHQWQAELSIPSRIPYLMATANLPILVLSNTENPATHFVERFEIGGVCGYDQESFRRAVEMLCTHESQQKFRANAAAAAAKFSSDKIAEWMWQSLENGEPADRRFESVFKRTSEVTPPWIDVPVPKEIWPEFIPTYQALSRLREAGFAPDFIIDAGASTGLWSDLCFKIYPKARYVLIDPLMGRYRAQSAWFYEQHPEFECEEAAISDQEGRMQFHVSNDMYGSSLMNDANDGRDYELIEVPVITLDGLADRKKFAGTGLLKLDIQFAEHLAIRGATQLLEQISVILVELSFQRISKEAKTFLEMINWLDELGYRYFDEAGGWRSPKNGIPIQQDVVFVKKGQLLS